MIERENFLCEKEAAYILGLSVRTIQKWRYRPNKILPYYKLGGAVRYSEKDLDDYLHKAKHSKEVCS